MHKILGFCFQSSNQKVGSKVGKISGLQGLNPKLGFDQVYRRASLGQGRGMMNGIRPSPKEGIGPSIKIG